MCAPALLRLVRPDFFLDIFSIPIKQHFVHTSLARTREPAASLLSSASRSRVLARLASLAQIGELARRPCQETQLVQKKREGFSNHVVHQAFGLVAAHLEVLPSEGLYSHFFLGYYS